MKAKARTLYLDNTTYKNLALLAGLKRTSRSSLVRILINEEFYQDNRRVQKTQTNEVAKG